MTKLIPSARAVDHRHAIPELGCGRLVGFGNGRPESDAAGVCYVNQCHARGIRIQMREDPTKRTVTGGVACTLIPPACLPCHTCPCHGQLTGGGRVCAVRVHMCTYMCLQHVRCVA